MLAPNSRFAVGDKFDQLERLLNVCGDYKNDPSNLFREHDRNGKQFRSMDWVDDEDLALRDARKAAHFAALKSCPPELMFCMRLGIEGYNDLSLQRGLMFGPRRPMGMRYQALGRLLRDYIGKNWVSYFTVVPEAVDRTEA